MLYNKQHTTRKILIALKAKGHHLYRTMTPSITQYFAITKKQSNDNNDTTSSTNGPINHRNNEVSVDLSFPVIVIDDDDENNNENNDCCEIITHTNEFCKEEKYDILFNNKSIDDDNQNFDCNGKKPLFPCTETCSDIEITTYVTSQSTKENENDCNNSNQIALYDTISNKHHTPTINIDKNDEVEHHQSPISLLKSQCTLNPFAKFAFTGNCNSIRSKYNTDSEIPTVQTTTSSKSCSRHSFAQKVLSLSTQIQKQDPPLSITVVETTTRENDQQTAVVAQNRKKRISSINNDQSLPITQQQNCSKKQKQKQCNDFIPIQQLSESDRTKEVLKWHSLIISNDDTPTSTNYNIEDRRFQLFVAVRLHARCQETTVRKVMNGLYDRLKQQQEQQPQDCKQQLLFNVQTFAKLDPIILSTWICNLQFYNTKAKQIIQSSNEIISKYNGIVPHTEKDLLQLIGIGPVFADLLSYVNTYDIHHQMMMK